MNLLLLERAEVSSGGTVRLTGRRAEHLLRVLRAEPGETLRLGVLGGGTGEGRVLAVDDGTVEVAVGTLGEPPAPPWIDLVVGLPRPAVLHRVLQTAAAMGVGRLDLTAAWRVEKSFFSSPSLGAEAIRRHLLLGAEQGMIPRLPEVEVRRLLVPFVRRLEVRSTRCRLLAHPGAPPLEDVFPRGPAAEGGRLLVAVGPEGGWIDREVETFEGAGFVPFSLGPWILRVETAVTAALAQVELLRRLGRAC